MEKQRLVYIKWVDSFGCSSTWEEIQEEYDPKPLICRSVGWLIHDGDDCKIIVPHLTSKEHDHAIQQGCGDMTIPTRAILKIVSLITTPV